MTEQLALTATVSSIDEWIPVERLTGIPGDVVRFIRRYVVLSPAQLVALGLWVLHAHVFAAAEQTPYMIVSSPFKECGKTRLIETLEGLVPRPWIAVGPSEAVTFRKIAAELPTLMLDEADTIFSPGEAEKHEGMRALLNSGNRMGATVSRCVGATGQFQDFPVYCPKLIAGIGTFPGTIVDRGVPIRLQRKTRFETAEPFRRREVEPKARAVRKRLEAWAGKQSSMEALRDARPKDAPGALSDRAQDAWEPLLAIADSFGHEWPALARRAAVTLHTADRDDDTESLSLQLLADLRHVYGAREKMASEQLVGQLNGLSDSPWATYRGRGLTAYDLSVLVKGYGVRPRTIRLRDNRTAKGYRKDQWADAWGRYLPPATGGDSA